MSQEVEREKLNTGWATFLFIIGALIGYYYLSGKILFDWGMAKDFVTDYGITERGLYLVKLVFSGFCGMFLVMFSPREPKKPTAKGDLGSADWSNSLEGLLYRKYSSNETDKRWNGKQPIFLGQQGDNFVGIRSGHLLCVAPTRTGKGVSSIIPNLLTNQASSFVLDIKGENYAVTHEQRVNLGQDIILIDIYGVTDKPNNIINPLWRLDLRKPQAQRRINGIVDAFVYDPPGGAGDPHWNESAKQLIKCVMYLVLLREENPNLIHVRDFLYKEVNDFLDTIEEYTNHDIGFVRNAANSILSKNEKEFGSILSTAQRHLELLQDVNVEEYFEATTNDGDYFTFDNLTAYWQTVYMIIPPEMLEASRRLIRLFIDQAIFENMIPNPERDIVFYLDEFAQIGRMERLEQAVTLAAGYNMRFAMYVQDLSQLKHIYGERKGTFLSNSTNQFFGVNDYETAKYLSDSMGNRTVKTVSANFDDKDMKNDRKEKGYSEQVTKRELMTPDEVMNLDSKETIVLTQGYRPMRIAKNNYLKDWTFHGLYGKNPYF